MAQPFGCHPALSFPMPQVLLLQAAEATGHCSPVVREQLLGARGQRMWGLGRGDFVPLSTCMQLRQLPGCTLALKGIPEKSNKHPGKSA